MKNRLWKVWFDQVNQSVYEVSAESKAEAVRKARQEWRRENDTPDESFVQEQPDPRGGVRR